MALQSPIDQQALTTAAPQQDESNIPSPENYVAHSPRYYAIFVNFMSYVHEKSTPYAQDHEFTSEELLHVTSNHVCAYLNIKAFGKASPGANDKLISNFSGVDFIRKAIEHCLPEENNPTRSHQVRSLLDNIQSTVKEICVDNEPFSQDHPKDIIEPAPIESNNDTTSRMLINMHNRHMQFLSVIESMDSTIQTLTKGIQQMKRALESQNLQIQNELGSSDEQAHHDFTSIPMVDNAETTALVIKLKEEESGIAAALNSLTENKELVQHPSMETTSIKIGLDGYCLFYNELGKEFDLPEGFELPTCDLMEAWTAWLTGFPDHKFRVTNTSDQGETESLVDAPIKPLRKMKLGCVPISLKKKYKDGWRPILQYMVSSIDHMLTGVSPSEMDDSFINSTFSAAMDALISRIPAMIDGKHEKSKTWKVATWSRKIREHTGSQRQKRAIEGAVQALDNEDVANNITTSEQV